MDENLQKSLLEGNSILRLLEYYLSQAPSL
jgi:hypothetical protein